MHCRGRRARTLAGTLGLIAGCWLAACSHPSPAAQAAEKREAIQSAAATARLVVRAWNAGDVPTAYASRTLEQAATRLESAAGPGNKLAESIVRLSEAVQQGNHALAAQQENALRR
ncbi:MAG: hypothetical protein H0U85_07670 [Gemmatimonadales bacterium]|nr:hypothetical protein [Gemmatimonadales bacterium]